MPSGFSSPSIRKALTRTTPPKNRRHGKIFGGIASGIFGGIVAVTLVGSLGCETATLSEAVSSRSQEGDDPASQPQKEAKLVRIGKIDWYTDYEEAAQAARQKKKPLWVHFGENPG